MPRNTVIAGPDWTLATPSDVPGLFTIQMRPDRLGPGGRLFLARGQETVPPGTTDGLFFDPVETTGHGAITLNDIDPGGIGNRLWCRFLGEDTICEVWLSWSAT